MNLPITGLPPGWMATFWGPSSSPREAATSAARASRSGMMPALGQYPVLPSRMACSAASTMFGGVGKSMSPRWKE